MKKGCCCPLCKVVSLLVIVGALNWGLVGAFGFNLVASLLGAGSGAEKAVYILVGVCAIVKLLSCFIPCPLAKKGAAPVAGDHKHDDKEGGCCGGH